MSHRIPISIVLCFTIQNENHLSVAFLNFMVSERTEMLLSQKILIDTKAHFFTDIFYANIMHVLSKLIY